MVIPDTQIMYNKSDNANVFDLYEVDSLRVGEASTPFVHGVEIAGPKGEVVRFWSVFDDGALVNAIDETLYHTLKGRLAALVPSGKILRMADGRKVPYAGEWRGRITVKGISREGAFEVFKSNRAWAMLFGKPLLQAFNAVHDYTEDTIRIRKKDKEEWAVLENQFTNIQGVAAKLLAKCTVDIKQLICIPQSESPQHVDVVEAQKNGKKDSGKTQSRKNISKMSRLHGGSAFPLEGSSTNLPHDNLELDVTDAITSPETYDREQNKHMQKDDSSPVWTVEENPTHPGTEQPVLTKTFEPTLLTRRDDPHNPARVKAILAEITISSDLSPAQRDRVEEVIAKHADCFALSMSEVTPVEGAAHRLDIPRDKQFKIKINQRPQTPPQKEFFNSTIDKMLEAGIIRPIAHQDVKCCSVTTLAKKAHEGSGRTLNELKHRINEQCIAAGFPSAFEELPPIEDTHPDLNQPPAQTKWRVCQDFSELNQVTKVPPMPQGDIRRKQQNLSGHRWVTIFDFANGFYACEIKPEDQPYVCFYVEGRGYYAYLRMPFGLTGGPSTFRGMTADALGDLIGILIELFVNDGGMAGDDFEIMLANTIRLLLRIRETGLSLSASKSKFFVTKATFAGGRVGPDGIKPDLTKLTAITDWKIPTDLQNLESFLGLAGYF